MRIISPKRKAISPVLATVILIAITLIAAVAIATFVFGIFGTSASPATMTIVSSSVACSSTTHQCTLKVANTGTTAGGISGAGPVAGGIELWLSGGAAPAGAASCAGVTPAQGTSVSIPANSAGTSITVNTCGMASGSSVSGFLVQNNGPNLYFTAISS
jgi:flagellin-like protein